MAGILNAIEISSRGLTVQRRKMDAAAENIANAETTETAAGGPYRRKRILVREANGGVAFKTHLRTATLSLSKTNDHHLSGRSLKISRSFMQATVEAEEIIDPASSFRLVHDPSHPDADEEGFVKMPDVEIVNEMVDMMAASRAYEANTVAIASAKKMAKDAMDI